MLNKEVSEIKRRFSANITNIRTLYGCFMNSEGKPVCEFERPFHSMSEEECDFYLDMLKKSLNGKIGNTLYDVSFSTKQVAEKQEPYNLLTRLRDCELKEAEIRNEFYQKIAEAYTSKSGYLILMATEAYDVPSRRGEDFVNDDSVFRYFVSAILPIQEKKNGLCFHPEEKDFCLENAVQAVGAPEIGVMFPAFDDRTTNLYGALYFSKCKSDVHQELYLKLFDVTPPISATEKKNTVNMVLEESLKKDCTLPFALDMQQEIISMSEKAKEKGMKEPPTLDKEVMASILDSCGMEEETIQRFKECYENSAGKGLEVNPDILVRETTEIKGEHFALKIETPTNDNVKIVEDRTGKWLAIRLDGDDILTVNGLGVH